MQHIEQGAPQTLRDRTLWFVVGAGTAVWAVHFFAMYVMVDLSCRQGWFAFTALGMSGIQVATFAITLVGISITGAAWWIGYRHWQKPRGDAAFTPQEDRARFMLFCGVILNIGYTALMILTFVSSLVVPPCR